MDRALGAFDSGIGGLTVLKEIMNILPKEDTIYLGDTARVPYGIKSAETVIRYSLENAEFLLRKHIKLLVVACNTASAVGLSALRASCQIPVVGVLEPGVKKAIKTTRKNRVGVIGTERTIESGAYFNCIKEMAPKVQVFSQPCPLFVPLVEEGWLDNDITFSIVQRYLQVFKNTNIDTLILGCTHYPLLKNVIKRVLGDEVLLIDSAAETALEVKRVLEASEALKTSNAEPVHEFYVTDAPERVLKAGMKFIPGTELKYVKQVSLI